MKNYSCKKLVTTMHVFFCKHSTSKRTQNEIKSMLKYKLGLNFSLQRPFVNIFPLLCMNEIWLDKELAWDDIYHESSNFSIRAKIKGHGYPRYLLLQKYFLGNLFQNSMENRWILGKCFMKYFSSFQNCKTLHTILNVSFTNAFQQFCQVIFIQENITTLNLVTIYSIV